MARSFLTIAVVLYGTLFARDPSYAADAHLRVVDVGNGLCVVGRTPDGHAFVYDAGFRNELCRRAVRALVGNAVLDLVVLSHSDQDHIKDLRGIVTDMNPRIILHPGDDRHGTTLDDVRLAIGEERADGATELSLSQTVVAPGRTFQIGSGTATFVAGWDDGNKTRIRPGPDDPAFATIGERRNALSIVIRFQFGGHSVLLTGDTIGRKRNESNSACRYAERIMVARRQAHPIDSDILIGQHHGGDNSSSNCFIRAVSPEYVVFSAGHEDHQHPRQSVADRFTAHGVEPEKMLRTDRGDNEGGSEWIFGAIAGCVDEPGDDDVDIFLPENPTEPVRVAYRLPSTGC